MGIAKRKKAKTLRNKSRVLAPKARPKKAPRIRSMVDLVNTTFSSKIGLRTGYAKVGISFDPNASISANAAQLAEQGQIESKEELRKLDRDASELQVPEDPTMQEWKESMEIEDLIPKGRNVFLAPMERRYWSKLIAKYGNDYQSMARDIKLNNYQHTPTVCQHKCEIYKKLYHPNLTRIIPYERKSKKQNQASEEQNETINQKASSSNSKSNGISDPHIKHSSSNSTTQESTSKVTRASKKNAISSVF